MNATLTKYVCIPAIMLGLFVGCAMDGSPQITMGQEGGATSSEDQGTANAVRFHWTALFRGGKGEAAIQLARESKAYFNTNYPEIGVGVYVEMFGDVGRLHWFAGYPDLATLERIEGRLQTDAGFGKIMARVPEVFERPQVTLMRLVP